MDEQPVKERGEDRAWGLRQAHWTGFQAETGLWPKTVKYELEADQARLDQA